jgi:hypothetical protein
MGPALLIGGTMPASRVIARRFAATRALLLGFSLVLLPAWANAAMPEGWMLAGSDRESYTADRDTSVRHGASASALLASTKASTGFGTMMQMIDAAEYTGQRIRLSGWVKSKSVGKWAGLWMRVDGSGQPPKMLAFDNMQSRPIKGTTDWTRYEVVLDVADNANAIAFGILLTGEGSVWLSDVRFEPVGLSVPTTGSSYALHSAPENLDFEH